MFEGWPIQKFSTGQSLRMGPLGPVQQRLDACNRLLRFFEEHAVPVAAIAARASPWMGSLGAAHEFLRRSDAGLGQVPVPAVQLFGGFVAPLAEAGLVLGNTG